MSVKIVINSPNKVSPRLQQVLKKMSASAREPAEAYRAREVAGTYVIYRPDAESTSASTDDAGEGTCITFVRRG